MTSKVSIPRISFNNGETIPIFGLGTWKSDTNAVVQAVKDAIDCGYRHLDCAFIYGNEGEVGSAIKTKIEDATIKREDIFITSKLWNTFHRKDLVKPAVEKSLSLLGVEYIDLYLIHWPGGYKEDGEFFPYDENGKVLYSSCDYLEPWRELEKCVDEGLIKSIGLSNFNRDQIQRVLDNARIKPVNLQVECHPYLNQKKLIEFCKSNGITFTCYAPLGSPARPWAKPDDPLLMEEAKILELAKKYKKTPAQILIRYQIDRGLIVIAKSVTKSRIQENIQVFDFELSQEDIAIIDSLHRNERHLSLTWINDHPYYPFNTEY